MVADHVGFLAEHELKERISQEELEAINAQNLSMRKQILLSQQKQQQVKNKARNNYI